MLSLVLNVAVVFLAFALTQRLFGDRLTALIAAGLLFVQLLLGLAAYVARSASPNDPQPLNPMISITVAHVGCGALLFAATGVLTLRAFRVLRVERQAYVLAPA